MKVVTYMVSHFKTSYHISESLSKIHLFRNSLKCNILRYSYWGCGLPGASPRRAEMSAKSRCVYFDPCPFASVLFRMYARSLSDETREMTSEFYGQQDRLRPAKSRKQYLERCQYCSPPLGATVGGGDSSMHRASETSFLLSNTSKSIAIGNVLTRRLRDLATVRPWL